MDHETHERARKGFREFRVVSRSSWSKGHHAWRTGKRDRLMPKPSATKGYEFNQLSYDTIGACIEVQSQLGVHCTEVDYQRALELALPKRGLQFEREVDIPITFDGVMITKRRVDFVVWSGADELILETKARSAILPEDVEQCLL